MGKVKADLWKCEQQSCTKDHTDQKGIDPTINHAKWLLGNIFDHKDIDRHRRNNHPDHYKNMKDDAKPYRIESKFEYDRIEDWSGQDHKGKVIDKRASYFIDNQNDKHNEVAGKRELHGPICGDHGDLRHCEKMAKNGGACNKHQDHTSS